MSYTKREWATGNVVGAVDLNRMEQGIEDASGGGAEPLIVNVDHLEGTLPNQYPVFDKTWNDVNNALVEGRSVVSVYSSANATVQNLFFCTGRACLDEVLGIYEYTASAFNPSATSVGTVTVYADSKDGYLQVKSFKPPM